MTDAAVRERSRDLDRFLTFLDAVVAIAITLLVLPLVDLTTDLPTDADVGDLLVEHQAEIWAFLLSSVVIARLWFGQHRTLRHVVAYDDRVAGLLMAWGLTIAFLPFPTALVAEVSTNDLTKVLYIGTVLASTVLMTLVAAVIDRRPGITDGEDGSDPVNGAASVVALALALAIALLVPATSYFPLLLLFLSSSFAAGWRRLRRVFHP
ncbi:TMEM175 family protein [Nocardioides sp.]|uniref:TMEM175 family protein n=1 Tax=Nocardioides sp. TaxID=35761 RepID=UPI0027268EA1|nr:TMEM175 family protein [Nocardioides sp.]MDO9454592.1 TMEM175 family protein [Nocardioides sp.]